MPNQSTPPDVEERNASEQSKLLPTVSVESFTPQTTADEDESAAILDAVQGPSLSFYQQDATDYLPFSRLVGLLRPSKVSEVIDQAASQLFDDKTQQYHKTLQSQVEEAEQQLDQVKHRLKQTWHSPPTARKTKAKATSPAKRRSAYRDKPSELYMSVPSKQTSAPYTATRNQTRWEFSAAKGSAFVPVKGLPTAERHDTLAYDRILERFRKRLEDQITDVQSHSQRCFNQVHAEIDTLRTDVRRLGEQQQDLLENVQHTFQDEVFRVQCDTEKQIRRAQTSVQQEIHTIRGEIDSIVAGYFAQYLEEAAVDMPESRELKPGHRLVMQRIRKNIDDMDARQQKQAEALEAQKAGQLTLEANILQKQTEAINELVVKHHDDQAALRESVASVKSTVATEMVLMKQQINETLNALQPKIRNEIEALMQSEGLKINAKPVRIENLHDGVKLKSELYTQVSLVSAIAEVEETILPDPVIEEPVLTASPAQFIRAGQQKKRTVPAEVPATVTSVPPELLVAPPQAVLPEVPVAETPVSLAPEARKPVEGVSTESYDNPVYSIVARQNRQMAHRMQQLVSGYFESDAPSRDASLGVN